MQEMPVSPMLPGGSALFSTRTSIYGAAERHAATELGARHAQNIADHPQQRYIAFAVDALRPSIDFDGERHLSHPLPASTGGTIRLSR
jgi:hypothetical protein